MTKVPLEIAVLMAAFLLDEQGKMRVLKFCVSNCFEITSKSPKFTSICSEITSKSPKFTSICSEITSKSPKFTSICSEITGVGLIKSKVLLIHFSIDFI
ncbi:hypothetical protein [Peribacillus simplex]|uniref:hypothetical protein n=1 Tax=Peribacillus simplex TaxID=1478 RepID=UPI003D2A91C2